MTERLSITALRSTAWSLTINNPTDADTGVELPAGWKLEGQYEVGAEGTRHFQGLLRTPQVRFSAVKKSFPRAHIEVAKNLKALEQYVHKTETKDGDFASRSSTIPTLWDYVAIVAREWNDDDFKQLRDRRESENEFDVGETALMYIDSIVARHIQSGMRGVEFISINPMWRTMWKKHWFSVLVRERAPKD